MAIQVEILAVGSELLGWQRVDTNSLWLTEQLNSLGMEVIAKAVVGDNLPRLTAAFRQALQSADVVISTGGLGPTEDDLTRQGAAAALGVELVERPELWSELQAWFARLGRPISDNNRRQALVPQGAEPLANRMGTAPGLFARLEDGRILVCLPGPPRELKPLYTEKVLPLLQPMAGAAVVRRRLLKVIGLGESAMDARIAPFYKDRGDVEVTVLFTPLDLEVHLLARGSDTAALDHKLAVLEEQICAELGSHVFARAPLSLAEVVGEALTQRGCTVACAESVTGGLVCERLSAVAGASRYLTAGFITYSERAKIEQLGVSPDLLAQHSAVSRPVAEAMAQGARERSGSDYALALTGYAGPEGASVGQIFLGLATPRGVESREVRFPGDRDLIRSRAAQAALDWLRLTLTEQ